MIKKDIQNAVKVAMKERQITELKVLRFVLSQIQYEEINKQKELTDEEVKSVLRKEVKKRKEAIEMFKRGNRQDLVDDEEKQIVIIEKFLPKQMSQMEIEIVIDEVLATTDKSIANMGKIMGNVMARLQGRADGSTVAQLLRKKLQG